MMGLTRRSLAGHATVKTQANPKAKIKYEALPERQIEQMMQIASGKTELMLMRFGFWQRFFSQYGQTQTTHQRFPW